MRRSLLLPLSLVLTACSSTASPVRPTPAEATLEPTVSELELGGETPIPKAQGLLEIWVPPLFLEGEDESRLAERVRQYESDNPGRLVNLRPKSAEDLYRTLLSASVAAPASLPDLVVLNPDDLQAAIEHGLLEPLNSWFQAPSEPDWYRFALPTTQTEELFYGLPFAADAELMVYSAGTFASPPTSWAEWTDAASQFVFPAADPLASFTVAQYLALGGELHDGSTLDPSVLSDILSFYFSSQTTGLLSVEAGQYESLTSTWNAFQAGLVPSATASLGHFLRQGDPEMTRAIPYPTRGGEGVSLTQTWVWAILASDPQRQEEVVQLLNWLMEPQFLGLWTLSLGLLPATSSALTEWPEGPRSAIASKIVVSAQERPPQRVLSRVGPPIRDAIDAVLHGGTSPDAAAQSAIERIQNP